MTNNLLDLRLNRLPSINGATPGDLLVIGNEFTCNTLEDQVREIAGKPVAQWKVPGGTAIPAGRYRVMINWSPHFQKYLPLLLNVPGFEGIRIHSLNTIKQTEGCVGAGMRNPAAAWELLDSRNTMERLFPIIANACHAGAAVFIDIKNGVLK